MSERCIQGRRQSFLTAIVVVCVTLGVAGVASANPIVHFNTTAGSFDVELFPAAAPQTVTNFLSYVNSGAYNNTFFHRSVHQAGFQIVQGGGYSASNTPFFSSTVTIPHIPTAAPIPLEYNLANSIGTIAMARTSALNSATSEFFFNVSDNTTNLGPANGGGYAVFGQVLGNGMDVINGVNALPTLIDLINGYQNSILGPIPLVNFTQQTTQLDPGNLVVITSATVVPEPSTVALASLGGAALVALSCRRAFRRTRCQQPERTCRGVSEGLRATGTKTSDRRA